MTELLRQFNKNGYLVLAGFNSAAECNALMKRGKELADGFDYKGHPSVFQTNDQAKTSDDYFLNSGDQIAFFFEKDAFDASGKLRNDIFHSLNKIGHALHDLEPVFNQFSRSPQMKQLARDLGLEDYLIIQSMLIFKHARIGGVVDVHQDSSFLYTKPDSCIGFWFALEDATTENGCLWATPGGHHTSMRTLFQRASGGGTELVALDATPIAMEEMIPLEVKKGDCIVLHGLLPHYSLPNTSGKSRQAYSIHTISPKAVYPKENWLQRDIAVLKSI